MIPRRQRRSRLRSLTLLIASQLLLSGCGLVGLKKDVKLGVPYRAQDPNSLNCGPASVLMWRLFDGLPEISQASIGAWMGGSNCGYGEARIADGVRHFTNTTDAYVDYEGEINHEEFFSRQITSIDRRKPVIAIVNSFHAGVVNGGKWLRYLRVAMSGTTSIFTIPSRWRMTTTLQESGFLPAAQRGAKPAPRSSPIRAR